MEQILVRGLPPGTKAALRARADAHHHSVEAEVRDLIARALSANSITLVDLIGMDDDPGLDFEPARLGLRARTADL